MQTTEMGSIRQPRPTSGVSPAFEHPVPGGGPYTQPPSQPPPPVTGVPSRALYAADWLLYKANQVPWYVWLGVGLYVGYQAGKPSAQGHGILRKLW